MIALDVRATSPILLRLRLFALLKRDATAKLEKLAASDYMAKSLGPGLGLGGGGRTVDCLTEGWADNAPE